MIFDVQLGELKKLVDKNSVLFCERTTQLFVKCVIFIMDLA